MRLNKEGRRIPFVVARPNDAVTSAGVFGGPGVDGVDSVDDVLVGQ